MNLLEKYFETIQEFFNRSYNVDLFFGEICFQIR